MDINKQDQVAGDNSAQFQANTINNNFYTIAGVSEEKAREICRHEFQFAMQNWIEQASTIAEQRVSKLEDKILSKMQSHDKELKMFSEPAFQILLRKAQISAACTDKEADYDMLSSLLLHRVHQENNRERNLGIIKAVEIVDQIDEQALVALTIVYTMSKIIPVASNVDLALQNFDEVYKKLLNGNILPLGEEWMEHLDMLSAIRMNAKGIGAFNKMEAFFPKVMDQFIVTGLPSDSEDLYKIIIDLRNNGIPTDIIIDNPLVKGNKIINPLVSDTEKIMFISHYSGQSVEKKPNEQQILTIKRAMQKFRELEGTNKPIDEFWCRWNSFPNLKNIREWFNQLPVLFNVTAIGRALVAAYVVGKIPSLKIPY